MTKKKNKEKKEKEKKEKIRKEREIKMSAKELGGYLYRDHLFSKGYFNILREMDND